MSPKSPPQIHFVRRQLALDHCVVMGVLNVTPDSFSDGGAFADPGAAVRHGLAMLAEGAEIVDIGGESTRPGATRVPLQIELDRVIPVVEQLRARSDAVLSVDTSRVEVMGAAVVAGADMVNDVRALREPGALAWAATARAPVCLMHMQGEPATMQQSPHYGDVLDDVRLFLEERAAACMQAGLTRDCLILDPGFGFGKTLDHNLTLLRGLDRIVAMGLPVLVGLSRKSMIGQLLGRAVASRLAGSLALAIAARRRGAAIVRVHDVGPTVDAMRIIDAIEHDDRQGKADV